jgi:hypothetical protein
MSQKLKFHQKEGVKFIIVFCNREVSSIERKKCNSARPWSSSKAKPWLGLLQKNMRESSNDFSHKLRTV